jgi:hypothetical protein
VGIDAAPPRAKRISAFQRLIIDHRRRNLLIKILRCVTFISFFASFWCGVIVEVIYE